MHLFCFWEGLSPHPILARCWQFSPAYHFLLQQEVDREWFGRKVTVKVGFFFPLMCCFMFTRARFRAEEIWLPAKSLFVWCIHCGAELCTPAGKPAMLWVFLSKALFSGKHLSSRLLTFPVWHPCVFFDFSGFYCDYIFISNEGLTNFVKQRRKQWKRLFFLKKKSF